MKHLIALPLVIGLSMSPALAQDEGGELRQGLDMLSEGTRMLLQGLRKEVEPALRELGDAIDDLNAYHPPEILPNGDIIIRRKEPLPVEQDAPAEGEIDL